MAQLWGGRFTKETDKLVYNFNASIGFDQKFLQRRRISWFTISMHRFRLIRNSMHRI